MGRLNLPWGWLLAGIALQLVSNGRWILPPATWLAPIGWLVFLERSPPRVGIPVAFGFFTLVEFVAWRGLVPAPGLLYYAIVGTYAVVYFAPFPLHRLLAPRVPGFAATLVFPVAWVGIEFAFQRWVTPYGSWFSIAYTQRGFLSLVQLAAFAGTAGVSFLIVWFGSVAAWMLRQERGSARRRRAVLTYGLVFGACLAIGTVRLRQRSDGGELVRIAGVLPSPVLTRALEAAFAPVRQGHRVGEGEMRGIAEAADRLNDDLFARTEREARAGAAVVTWSETAGRVLARDEPQLLERARRLARLQQVDLLLAYGVWIPGAAPPLENKAVAVSREGAVVWEFLKARPIVGPESPFVRAGDGIVHAMATPSGQVGVVICHDLDFPGLVRQAQRLQLGLMIGPSADWRAITPLHANMAVLRAVESGFSLFRPTSTGRSVAVDTRGRTLMAVDYATDVVLAHVPSRSVRTPYGLLGDWFAWVCLGALLVGAGVALAVSRG